MFARWSIVNILWICDESATALRLSAINDSWLMGGSVALTTAERIQWLESVVFMLLSMSLDTHIGSSEKIVNVKYFIKSINALAVKKR